MKNLTLRQQAKAIALDTAEDHDLDLNENTMLYLTDSTATREQAWGPTFTQFQDCIYEYSKDPEFLKFYKQANFRKLAKKPPQKYAVQIRKLYALLAVCATCSAREEVVLIDTILYRAQADALV